MNADAELIIAHIEAEKNCRKALELYQDRW